MTVPSMGNRITSGKLTEWKVTVGDCVKANDVVCVIDTDKVSVMLEAQRSGRVMSLEANVGDTLFVGGNLMTIEDSDSKYNSGIRFRHGYNSMGYDMSEQLEDVSAKGSELGQRENSVTKRLGDQKRSMSDAKHLEQSNSIHTEWFSDLASLPHPMGPTQLTEEEVELINMGGLGPSTDKRVGVWRSNVSRVS